MLLASCAHLTLPALAQTPSWDNSGNKQLNGSYYFRQVYYQLANNSGDLAAGRALFGTITFDGTGHYAVSNATLITRSQTATTSATLSVSGTYSIAANGYGFLSGLYCPPTIDCPNNSLYVLVAQGMLVGSSPENNLNDVFIAAPTATSQTTASPFQGTWTMAGYLPAIGNSAGYASDVFFRATPDGAGNLGNVTVTGYYGVNQGASTTQQASAVTYSSTPGAASINFPSGSTSYFYGGAESLYFSPDGTFCFGGSLSSPDLLVGVRNGAAGSSQTLSGIFYGAGIDQNEYFLSRGTASFGTWYEAFNAAGGKIIAAQRLRDPVYGWLVSNTVSSTYPTTINTTYTAASETQYAVNGAGTIRIGAGIGPFLGLSVDFKAPAFTGSGVYLYPNGISNAASFAPFTEGISPGEYIVLYGTGLAAGSTVAGSLPLPTTLGNVKVTVNGVAAPVYYVTPGQISIIVPSGTTGPVAQIQVINNGTASNAVTVFVRKTTPGLFTNPPDGVSLGAFEHADGSLVTEASPVKPGETIQAFLTGLGAVSPAVPDGAAAPTTTLSYATNQVVAFFGWARGTVTFAGLTPTLAALYQVNVQVPAVVPTGDQIFELDGPDGFSTQGIIPVLSDTPSGPPPK